jgi:hypothetical protein
MKQERGYTSMPRPRYQLPEPERRENTLPTDTICTILTRQSTISQGRHNIFSSEKHPDELRQIARSKGFSDDKIVVVDLDMGIGAYNTTIEDRPGLHQWLTQSLPSGESRVVLVSAEDRLFRDRTEIQVNRFIEHVSQHHGWVVCGTEPYNFLRETDREQFRGSCKYGRQYIDHHIKGRLHPARRRSAESGRYVGGITSWGYVVDVDSTLPSYKHLIPYRPHATLVDEQVFTRFMHMTYPSVSRLAAEWEKEGLVWPAFDPSQAREKTWFPPRTNKFDPHANGYLFSRRQAELILTDVRYLGYMVFNHIVICDEAGQPCTFHEALIDPDLFWWCFDQLEQERPPWAPATSRLVAIAPKVRILPGQPAQPHFIGQGLIHCPTHGRALIAQHHPNDDYLLICRGDTSWRTALSTGSCPSVPRTTAEAHLLEAFIEQLTFDEVDSAQLAHLAHARIAEQRHIPQLQQNIADAQARYERLIRRVGHIEDDAVAADVMNEAQSIKRTLDEWKQRLTGELAQAPVSDHAWRIAEQAQRIVHAVRETFHEWPRDHQARVLRLALRDGMMGTVTRRDVGLWLQWADGAETHRLIQMPLGRHINWTPEEDVILIAYFQTHSQRALEAMLPLRTFESMGRRARALGIYRPRHQPFVDEVPAVVAGPVPPNTMESYGFSSTATTIDLQGITPRSGQSRTAPRRSRAGAGSRR